MKKIVCLLLASLLQYGMCVLDAQTKNRIPLPSAAQLEWQQKEQIMFVHFGPAAFQGREYDNLSSDIHKMYLSKLNTDQWCQVARSWGAKMIIFVAKHIGGFCWWQTGTTDYSVKNTPWKNGKGDVMRDLSASCKKYGLDLGVYIYPGDEHWGANMGSGGLTKDPSRQEEYNKIYRQQLIELFTRYGTIKEVWFDGSCRIDVKDILAKYATHSVIFQGPQATLRWVGNEDGYAPDPNWYTLRSTDLKTGTTTALHSDVNGDAYAPVEVDVPFLKNGGHKWFWAPGTDSLIMSRSQLMNLYYNSVGRGSVLLLNSTPDTTGLIPSSHVAVYKDFGETIKRYFGHPILRTKGIGSKLLLRFGKVQKVNHIILQEDLSKGQRVLSYRIDGSMDGKKWHKIEEGTSVGNKKIDFFDNQTVRFLRLTVTRSKDVPYIKDFSAYYVAERTLAKNDKKGQAVKIGYWEANTFDIEKGKTLSLDLTPYVNSIGQYEISFETKGYDYSDSRPGGLELSNIQLSMYGHEMNTAVEYFKDKSMLRITRSQQTLNDFPTRLTMIVKRRPCKTYGIITLKKVTY